MSVIRSEVFEAITLKQKYRVDAHEQIARMRFGEFHRVKQSIVNEL